MEPTRMSGHRNAGTAIKCKQAQWAGRAKDVPPRTDKWIRIKQSIMNMKRTVKIVLTAFFRWIGKLYSSLRTLVHVLFMYRALVLKVVKDLLEIDSLPYWIGFAQKRVAKRRFHGCKDALFPARPVEANISLVMSRNNRSFSEKNLLIKFRGNMTGNFT